MTANDPRSVRHVAAAAQDVVLVCRKCSRRLGGGFGPDRDQPLAKMLRRATGTRGKPRRASIAIVEVGCLDLCPKGAVVVLRGGRPGDWLVVPGGTDVAEVCAHLGLEAAGAKEE